MFFTHTHAVTGRDPKAALSIAQHMAVISCVGRLPLSLAWAWASCFQLHPPDSRLCRGRTSHSAPHPQNPPPRDPRRATRPPPEHGTPCWTSPPLVPHAPRSLLWTPTAGAVATTQPWAEPATATGPTSAAAATPPWPPWSRASWSASACSHLPRAGMTPTTTMPTTLELSLRRRRATGSARPMPPFGQENRAEGCGRQFERDGNR